MVMIANYQYGWTFFVPDIQKTFGWDRASIQWAFTLFVLFETWLVPVEGWFVDKYGPRLVVLVGGILCAIGWAINAQATTLNGYYLGMIIAGIGAGGVYGTCVGNALKWFPDKRGLAAGITAAGFGAAWFLYLGRPDLPELIKQRFGGLYALLDNKYYLDRINELVFGAGARLIGTAFWRGGDMALIDGAAVNGSARLVGWVALLVRRAQTGFIYHYAFAMLLGVGVALFVFLTWPYVVAAAH